MNASVLKAAWRADALRFARAPSLWLLLLSAPVAARFMIAERQGEGINIAVGGQIPILTSPVFGIWLGIVVSMFVMPAGYIYLRAGPTRRQPWQVSETTPASRIAIALGRFAANAAVLVGVLLALTAGGLILAAFVLTGLYQPLVIIGLCWLVALPTLLVTAALHVLFDARPWLRGGLGDFLFFVLWIATITVGAAMATTPSSFGLNLAELGGAVRPLVESAPPGSEAFAIGASDLRPGRIALDPMRGVLADGYIAARTSWMVLAVGIAVLAGLLYRPHKLKARSSRLAFLSRVSDIRWWPGADPAEVRARRSSAGFPGLMLSEARLIALRGWVPILLVGTAMLGLAEDYRRIGNPAMLLVLIFALTDYAGMVEARGFRSLARTFAIDPWKRRLAFVLAGAGIAVLTALPAAASALSAGPLVMALATGGIAGAATIGLAALSGSAVLPRITLLAAWYGWFSGG